VRNQAADHLISRFAGSNPPGFSTDENRSMHSSSAVEFA